MSKRMNMPSSKREYMDYANRNASKSAESGFMVNKSLLNPRKTEFPIKMSNWFLTLFLLLIPVINLLALLNWAFGPNAPLSKRNFARAALLIGLILINIIAIAVLVLYFVFDINVATELKLLLINLGF